MTGHDGCLQPMIETVRANWQQEGAVACILSVIAAVAVAMPLMRCMKFNAMRSATKMDRALPFTVPNVVHDFTWSPSFPVHCTDKHGSTVEKTCAKRSVIAAADFLLTPQGQKQGNKKHTHPSFVCRS